MVRGGGVVPVRCQRREGVELDADDPAGKPGRDVRGPLPARPAGQRSASQEPVDGVAGGPQLGGEGCGRPRRVQVARLQVGLVRQIDPLHQIDRRRRMSLVVGEQFLIHLRRVDRVDPQDPDAQPAHLGEPAPVVLPADRQLARAVPRRRAAEIDPGPEGHVAGHRVQRELAGDRLGQGRQAGQRGRRRRPRGAAGCMGAWLAGARPIAAGEDRDQRQRDRQPADTRHGCPPTSSSRASSRLPSKPASAQSGPELSGCPGDRRRTGHGHGHVTPASP